MWIEINIDKNVDINEMKKVISFVSEDIVSYKVENNILRVELKNKRNSKAIVSDIILLFKKFKIVDSSFQKDDINFSQNRQYYSNILNNEELFGCFEEGLYYLKGKAIFLFKYFEKRFSTLATEMGAIQKQYPVLLPVDDYLKTGYISRSPQYSIFCSNAHENMKLLEGLETAIKKGDVSSVLNNPRFALSPSACFHVYMEYKNQVIDKNQTVSFTQNVFRNEGRLNYNEAGRLMDYHVKEIVFLGDEEYVNNSRKEALRKTKELLNEWGLCAYVQKASDPFVLPKMQKYKKIQLLDASKYEVRIWMGEDDYLAVASYNLHGTAFSYPFNIKMECGESLVTGCVGFGLERWVISFLTQFGSNENNWPDSIRKEYTS